MVKDQKNLPHIEAYRYSLGNKEYLANDTKCGCYNCLTVFTPGEIQMWLPDAAGETAICPHCGIDAVIGESCGHKIEFSLLQKMQDYWM